MQTIRTRLSLNTFLVLLLGMTLAGALAWRAVERMYVDTQRENLLAQARLIAAALEGSALPTESVQPYSQQSNVMPGVHTRILGEGGAVVVGLPLEDSFTQMPAAEQYVSIPTADLIRRSEIDSALKGTPATAIRRVLDDQRVLYAAAPVYAANGQISGIVYIATPLPAGGLPANIILQLLGAILLAVLLATFAGSLLARRIARPLERLAEAATAISKGDLKQRVETDNRIAELHSLSHTFNEMAESLRQSDEAKKAFIADVTHELRTPLTVIKGTIETLEDGALDDAEGRGPLLASMQRETDRLIRLVNELLVLTRADAGSLQLNLQSLDLAELAETRCEVFSGLAARRGVALKVDSFGVQELAPANTAASCLTPNVLADPDRLAQVIDNLLDNAIRHSPENSTIMVTIKSAHQGVECSVADQGTGIPARHLPFIFERFYRVDAARARNRRDGGTGLGLAIARALVNAHGGGISAQSLEGKGTTITFWLPEV
ncbi:MAG: HAMP domain-containing protein [Anaerolineales bacterium]|nr:HAMP domain-containing protein [Anaerolineales bacterium]